MQSMHTPHSHHLLHRALDVQDRSALVLGGVVLRVDGVTDAQHAVETGFLAAVGNADIGVNRPLSDGLPSRRSL